MPRVFSGAVAVILILFLHTAASAQATGSIAGTVEDDTGGVLPGVTVSVSVAGAPAVPETVTDASGAYRFDQVPVGPAELSFRLINFSSGRRTVAVTAGATTTANVKMVVTVSADIVITASRTFRNLAEMRIQPRTSSASRRPAAKGPSRRRSSPCVR
jgi:hypothetical protein